MARIKYYDPKTNEWTYADSNVIDVSRSDEIYVLGDGETLEDAPTDAVMVISPDGYVDIPSSGGNVAYDEAQNLTDAQKAQARENIGAQPAGNYLTEVPDGYAKTADVPTDEEIIQLIKDNAPESSGGGIAVTGAKVGQTVKISAVDANGVPTAWEPTDFPSGGGSGSLSEKWELISEGTITEETAGLDISEDINGEPFKLSKCYFYCVIQPCETVVDSTKYITTKINGRTAMQNANCAANTVRYYQCLAFLTGAAVIGGQAVSAQKYNHNFAFTNNSPDYSNWEGVDSINKVSLVTSNAGVLFVGVNSTYKLYGVRA